MERAKNRGKIGTDRLSQINKIPHLVMLNLVQHLIKSIGYETLKRVQGDISRVWGQPH